MTNIRVRYGETDQMGVVYYANYLEWFTIGRTEFLRDKGYTYKEMEEQEIYLPVTEAHIRYRRSAKYDDVITIKTTLTEMSPTRLKFSYEIYRDDTLLAEGYTTHAFINKEGRVCSVKKNSPEVWQSLEKVLAQE